MNVWKRRVREPHGTRLGAERLERRQVLSADALSIGIRSRLDRLGGPAPVAEQSRPVAAPAPAVGTGTFQSTVLPPTANARAPGSWTIMVYITGDNLNDFAAKDINEMEAALVGLPSSVKFVTAWDQYRFAPSVGVSSYATGGGTQPAWNGYGMSVLQADANMNSIASRFDLSVGEQNTGSPATLENFIKWAAAQAPADKYILQIWDHGGGLVGSNTDYESGGDTLEISEVVDVLGRPGVSDFQIVSYDNCLMGMAEIGFSFDKELDGFFVASEDNIAGTGQDYRRAYQSLVSNPGAASAAQVAAGMVTAFGAQYPASARGGDTFSATKTSAYPAFTAALKAFTLASDPLGAVELAALRGIRDRIGGYDRVDGSAYRDVGTLMSRIASQGSLPQGIRDAARQVITALAELVPYKTVDFYNSSGVSIYLPKSANEYPGRSFTLATYRQKFADFCRATEWDRFVEWINTGIRPPPPPGPAVGPSVTLAVGNLQVTEGDVGTVIASVPVRLSAAAAQEVSFSYRFTAATATAGSDFVAGSGTLRVAAGATTATIPVAIVGDRVVESEESFAITISNAVNATIQTATGTVTIRDNDVGAGGPTVTVTGAAIGEGHFGTPVLRFMVSLASAPRQTATVDYTTLNGTARAGEDYFAARGSVTFRPGETLKFVDVRIVGDTRVESDETLTLQLSSPKGVTLGMSVALGTILNDDSGTPPPPPPPPEVRGGFQVTLTYPDSTVTVSQKLVFDQAAARWSQIITGDLPEVIYQGRRIDDLEISVTAPFIDGPAGVLGSAGPREIRRDGSRLPFLGAMRFDSADMASMERDGSLLAVILHEMGHVLGLGTLWESRLLVQGLGTSNPVYIGARAVAEYRTIFGLPAATSIPVENTGGPGTAGGHWRESVFDAELMSGYAEPTGRAMPLSRITIGALEDLGYAVSYSAADAYTPPRTGGGVPAGNPARVGQSLTSVRGAAFGSLVAAPRDAAAPLVAVGKAQVGQPAGPGRESTLRVFAVVSAGEFVRSARAEVPARTPTKAVAHGQGLFAGLGGSLRR
jgi:hypothetical protein